MPYRLTMTSDEINVCGRVFRLVKETKCGRGKGAAKGEIGAADSVDSHLERNTNENR